MFDDVKAIKEMQRVQAGGVAKLSKSQIVIGAFNLKDMTQGLEKLKADECCAFYDKMRKCKTKETYDARKLITEIEIMQQCFDKIINHSDENVMFRELLDCVEDFLTTKPFVLKKELSYGFQEVCVFASVEYLAWIYLRYANTNGRKWYKNVIQEQSDIDTAELLMSAYDGIQGEIADNATEVMKIDYSDAEKVDIGIHLIAFAAIKRMILREANESLFKEILSQGDVKFVTDFYNNGSKSDGTNFMNNFVRLINFLVGCCEDVIMPYKRKNA